MAIFALTLYALCIFADALHDWWKITRKRMYIQHKEDTKLAALYGAGVPALTLCLLAFVGWSWGAVAGIAGCVLLFMPMRWLLFDLSLNVMRFGLKGWYYVGASEGERSAMTDRFLAWLRTRYGIHPLVPKLAFLIAIVTFNFKYLW